MRHSLLLLPAALLLGAAPPSTPVPPAPVPAASEAPDAAPDGLAIDLGKDANQRMTVLVNISGSGPYKFVVDTGAERTVIASDLAATLRLDPGGIARLHSMSEVSDIATVLIPMLEVGGKRFHDIKAPALERRNLGAEGMLGVDALQAQRVSFDFKRQAMTIVPSRQRKEVWEGDAIVVMARSRFGHLVLLDSSVEGQKVWVIVDTGAQESVGNSALRAALERHHRLPQSHPTTLISVTGGHIAADQTMIKTIQLGDVVIHDMPIDFADVEPFRKLDLLNRPALLLGMDALQLFDRVSVDFANRRVTLLPAGRSRRDDGPQMARVYSSSPHS